MKYCGSCDNYCGPIDDTVKQCVAGQCKFLGCDPGWKDCGKWVGVSCRTDIAHSPNDCGACGHQCPFPSCGPSIQFNNTDWKLNQAASYDANAGSFVLTPAQRDVRGSVIYARAIFTDSFTASFDIRISGGSGGDGMAFMLETDGSNWVGSGGAGLGIAGLHGFGVELDTYNNHACGDTSDNHVGLDLLSACQSFFTALPTSLVTAPSPVGLRDGNWHSVVVELAGGFMSVSIDQKPAITAHDVHASFPGTYYFGFAAATGGQTDRHEVRNLKVVFPTSRCL